MTTRNRTTGTRRARRPVRVLGAAAVCAVVLGLSGCAGSGEGVRVEGSSAIPRDVAEVDAAVDVETMDVVVDAAPGGVVPTVSVTFRRAVPAAERPQVERDLRATLDMGAEGTWSWVEPGTRATARVGADLSRRSTVAH
jgi:hypothetical protein